MLRLFQHIAPPFAHHYGVRFNYRQKLGITTYKSCDDDPPDPIPYHERVVAMHKSLSCQSLRDQAELLLSSHKSTMESIRSGHDKAKKDLQDSFEVAMSAVRRDHKQTQLHVRGRVEQQREEIEDLRAKCDDLRKRALTTVNEKMWLEQNFNIRGALERIVYQYRQSKDIRSTNRIQEGLDSIATEANFIAVLEKEVRVRELELKKVKDCVHNLYHEVSKHAHGNDGTILVRAIDFTPNERAALAAFLTLQSTWKNALIWREIGLPDKGNEVL